MKSRLAHLVVAFVVFTNCFACMRGQFKIRRAQESAVVFAFVAPEKMQAGVEFDLSWSAISDAQHYTLVISNDAECADPVFKLNKLTGLQQSITLTAVGNYYACVFATMADGTQVAASNNGKLLRVEAQAAPTGLAEFALSADIWGIDSEPMTSVISSSGRDNVLFKLDSAASSCDDLTWTQAIAIDKTGKVTGTPAAQTDVVTCTLVVTASSAYDSVTQTFEVALYPKHPAGFVCSGGGDLKTVCKVNTVQTFPNLFLIAGPGSIQLQSGGELSTSAKQTFAIKLGGDFTAESSGKITGNLSTLTADNVDIQLGAEVNADALGESGGTTAGTNGAGLGGGAGSGNAGGGGAHGGRGGDADSGGAGSTVTYGLAGTPTTYGSGGGGSSFGAGDRGGYGGGIIKIEARNKITIDGSVTARGEQGANLVRGGGGGAGGSIWMIAQNVVGSGVVSVKGGAMSGGGGYGAGSGGGGRIAIDTNKIAFSGTIDVTFGAQANGSQDTVHGDDGTYYTDIKDICDSGTLNTTCTVSTTKPLGHGQNISGTGSMVVSSTGKLATYPNLAAAAINMSGDLTVAGTIAANMSSVSVRNFHLLSTGNIDLSAQGYYGGGDYDPGRGPGFGQSGTGGGGAGHGGAGGHGWGTSLGGGTYGVNIAPVTMGSGGGGGQWGMGGTGGGAIKISASQAATIDGTISVNGTDAEAATRAGGGGAGGSIWLQCGTLSGSGTFTANGGNGLTGQFAVNHGGGGAGGRIALEYSSSTFSGGVSASGGAAGGGAPATAGASGTICLNGAGGSC